MERLFVTLGHNQKTKLRSRVIEQAGNERFEDKYSDLVEQEEKLNHKKPVMRQKELTSRNLTIPASQSTPHFKLHIREALIMKTVIPSIFVHQLGHISLIRTI